MENEKMVNSLKWLFGGNYTPEMVQTMIRIIQDYEGLCYLERENVLDILSAIKENGIEFDYVNDWIVDYLGDENE